MIIELFYLCLCFFCLWLFCKLDQFGFFEVVINKFYSQTLFISIVSFFVSLFLCCYLSTSLKSEHVTSTFKYKMLENSVGKTSPIMAMSSSSRSKPKLVPSPFLLSMNLCHCDSYQVKTTSLDEGEENYQNNIPKYQGDLLF